MTGPLHFDSQGRIFEQFPIDEVKPGQTVRIGHMMPVQEDLAALYPDGRPLVAEVDYVVADPPLATFNRSLGIQEIRLVDKSHIPIDPTMFVLRERGI